MMYNLNREGGGRQQEHTHYEGERGEGKRETEARWDYMGGSRSTCAKRVQNAHTHKNNPHRVRKVPKYKRATNAQIIDAPEAKDSATGFGSKFWPRPSGEPENRLVASKGRYTEIHAHSLEGTCGPFVRGGRARASVWGVLRPLSLSLCPLFQEYGCTALICASINGHATVVELLLAAKADTNLKGPMSLPSTPQRDIEDERPPSPNACTCIPTLTKGPHLPSRLWA